MERFAALSFAIAMTLAFVMAWLLQSSSLLSLVPPPSQAVPNPAPDVAVGQELPLYQSAFTAWAALLLMIPAYVWVWGRDPRSQAIWRSFWAASCAAYLIHLFVSMGLFFDWDFAWMQSTSRVSAFWPGMIIAIWWPIDIALAKVQGTWVTVQRVLLHVLVLVLFVGGSAFKGELTTVQMMGWALLLSVVGAAVGHSWRARRG